MESNVDSVKPSMRLKVKPDTFFLPGADDSVYFRNNEGSFQMAGRSIFAWVEKLLPAFNGKQTLQDLTDGLSTPYQNRVYEIANVLYQNGFARDVSQDMPHQLPESLQKAYAPQIEFLDSLASSGAFRFQTYRQTKVLAVGSGPFLGSLVHSLFESGLPEVTILVQGDGATIKRDEMENLVCKKRKTDPGVCLRELRLTDTDESSLQEAFSHFDVILYVSVDEDIDKLLRIQALCQSARKLFLPAIFTKHAGIAGPVVYPDVEGSFGSVWHRIHKSALRSDCASTISQVAVPILANLLVFELFKTTTGVSDSGMVRPFYLQNPDTLEGKWHSFLTHPSENGFRQISFVEPAQLLAEKKEQVKLDELLLYFGELTDPVSGIFHIWDEGDLMQLPLSACRVCVADPLSTGPAELLPEIVCRGMTHEEARCEAGFAGIEHYVSRVAHKASGSLLKSGEFVGIGTGASIPEAIWRGLYQCLTHELAVQIEKRQPVLVPVPVQDVEDETCAFYLKLLRAADAEPVISFGDDVLGLPVAWVESGGKYACSPGISRTMAIRNALWHLVSNVQSDVESRDTRVPPTQDSVTAQDILSAMERLKENGRRMLVLDAAVEPFLTEVLAGVFGVLLRQEASL